MEPVLLLLPLLLLSLLLLCEYCSMSVGSEHFLQRSICILALTQLLLLLLRELYCWVLACHTAFLLLLLLLLLLVSLLQHISSVHA
jgi:hypothetical protein